MNQIGLLLRLYIRPLSAFSRIIDEGRMIFAVVAAVAAVLALQIPRSTAYYRQEAETYSHILKERQAARATARTQAQEPASGKESGSDEDDEDETPARPPLPSLAGMSIGTAVDRWIARPATEYFPPLLALAVCFVPVVILVLTLWDNLGGFATILFRDYLTLLVCCLLAWSAAYLPLALVNGVLLLSHHPAYDHPALWYAAQVYFLSLSVLAIRTVFGTRAGHAVVAAASAWTGAVGGIYLSSIFGGGTAYLASPFMLYYLYQRLSPDFFSLGTGLQSRQRLKQHLENATLNPRDADAHYQLGLIYQQRRQYEQAIERFRKAIAVDPEEADAYFQLGKIAREQGHHEEALQHFQTTARLDDQHASSEVWREIGVVRLSGGSYEEARQALEKYLNRRPYDPEGNCWYGRTLARLGRREEAHAAFEQAIEAVRTMPSARKRQVRGWESEARQELKKVRG